MRTLPSSLIAGVVLATSVAGLGCVTNPATGKTQLALVSEEEAARLGAEAAKQTVDEVGLVDDPALQSWVQQVGTRIARVSERPDIPWRFQVVNDASVNAFALPGGYIFVTRGILVHLDTEAELAAVLGHEIGHVTAAHSISQISKQELAGIGLGLGAAFIPGFAPYTQLAQLGLGLLLLKYGRDAEREADQLGFRYSTKAAYDPAGAVELFEMLGRTGEGEGRLPGWLTTHPAPEERLEAAKKRVAQAQGPQPRGGTDRDAYLRRIDGLPYGNDPRNGYFIGNAFVHPQLRLELDFPEGWKTQDSPRAVQAIDPNGTAAITLALTSETSPDAAMRKFGSTEGVTTSDVSATPLNALPAATSRFAARTKEGDLTGLVSFVRLGERTYQLVGFSRPETFASVEPVLRTTFESFRPVTDEKLLNPKTPRVRIVALPEAMTLTEFQRREPSAVSVEDLARLNGVPPEEVLEKGWLVKRVVAD